LVLLLVSTALLVSCGTVLFENLPLKKTSQRIKFLVMHYSAKNYQNSLAELVAQEATISAHYLVPENQDKSYPDERLKVIPLIKESNKAQYVSKSFWQGSANVNDLSIGIDLVNLPVCERVQKNSIQIEQQPLNSNEQMCFYPDYDPQQIQLVIKLSKDILARNPDILPTQVVGHADINPQDKNDPGPRFPWYQLYQHGVGAWYDKETVSKYWHIFLNKQIPNIGLWQAALHSYGYHLLETGQLNKASQNVITAFQMHFLPWQVTGIMDEKTSAVLFALLEKYFPNKVARLITRYQQELTAKVDPIVLVKKGQIDQIFPQPTRSSRALVNDRAIFKSYRRRGQIIINNNEAVSADIYVNGQQLNIAQPLLPYHRYVYSLKKRTKSGDNTLRVENVLPEGATINVVIPFPQLIDRSHQSQYFRRFNKVDQLINQDIKNGFPGAVLVVIKDGEILKNTAYGYARKFADGGELLKTPVSMTNTTLFDIASNTKMFATNFALMKLVSEGKLDVNKPIVEYLPLYRGSGREMRLVKDVLTHNAGYSPQVKFFTHDNELGEQFFSQNVEKTKQLILTKVPFKVGRHSKRMYSDTDYMLLGMLVEKLTGMSLDSYVENNIYHLLHLEHSVFNPLQKGFAKNQIAATEIRGNTRGGRVKFDHIREYVLQGEVHDEKAYYSLGGVAGHAGLFATAKDLSILAQVLLNRGGYGKVQLFSPSVMDQFIKPDDGDGSYGLGWRRADNGARKWQFGPYASSSAFGHTGWTGTVTVIDPEHDLAIILLTNARHSEVEGDDKNYQFKGKQFETGNYGSVISLVYEAILDH